MKEVTHNGITCNVIDLNWLKHTKCLGIWHALPIIVGIQHDDIELP